MTDTATRPTQQAAILDALHSTIDGLHRLTRAVVDTLGESDDRANLMQAADDLHDAAVNSSHGRESLVARFAALMADLDETGSYDPEWQADWTDRKRQLLAEIEAAGTSS